MTTLGGLRNLRPGHLVVVAALVLSPACAVPADRGAGSIAFGECPSALASDLSRYAPGLAPKVDLSCGQLDVPLDYAKPDAEKITLQVVRAKHQEQSERIGSIIFHPGGPGQPGVDYLPFLLSWVPESALKRFDLVSLDPRGAGGSAPINCPTIPDAVGKTNPNVLTEAGFSRASVIERQASEACLQVLGSRAPYFNTETAARDVDRLRQAVGDKTLTYLGGSYGAKLGAEYARQFPSLVRAAVLDGPSEPTGFFFEGIARQTRGFENTFNVYAKGCPTRPACHLGDPQAFLTKLVASADADPIVSLRRGDNRPANGADVLQAVRAAMTDERAWADLDEILEETADGNSGGIFALIENIGGRSVEDSAPADPSDAGYVINCNDSTVGPTDEQIRTEARAMAREFPIFGIDSAFNLFACKTWQPQRSVLQPPVAATMNRLLVIGTVNDAATPYRGAVELTRILGNATLLTWDGNSHTAMGHSTCIAEIAARYLIDLTVPADGTHCPP